MDEVGSSIRGGSGGWVGRGFVEGGTFRRLLGVLSAAWTAEATCLGSRRRQPCGAQGCCTTHPSRRSRGCFW